MIKVKYMAKGSLLIAVVMFFFSLYLNKNYPGNKNFIILMFISEAAMVGGLADWFAVTALFKNPVDFIIKDCYGTAIVPKARKELVKRAGSFIEQIITKDLILDYLNSIDCIEKISLYWKRKEIQEEILIFLTDILKNNLESIKTDFNIRELAKWTRDKLLEYRIEHMVHELLLWIKKDDNSAKVIECIAPVIAEEIESEKFKHLLENNFNNLEKERINSLLSWALKKTDLLNVNDAAESTQKQLIKLIKEVGKRNSETQVRLIKILVDKADENILNKNVMTLLDSFRKQIIQNIPLEDIYKSMLTRLYQKVKDEEQYNNIFGDIKNTFRHQIEDILYSNIDLMINKIKLDSELHNMVDSFFKQIGSDIACNVEFSKVTKVVVRKAVKDMSDEQLIKVIKTKVEDDLYFIRINGAIVGGIVGGVVGVISLILEKIMTLI